MRLAIGSVLACAGASGCGAAWHTPLSPALNLTLFALLVLGGVASLAMVLYRVVPIVVGLVRWRCSLIGALLFLLAALPARADPWSALMPGVALNPMPAAVDDPSEFAPRTIAARVAEIGAETAPNAAVRARADSVPPGAQNLAPVVADCSACARDLVPASKWPWWGTLLISIAASGAAVADHWITRVAP